MPSVFESLILSPFSFYLRFKCLEKSDRRGATTFCLLSLIPFEGFGQLDSIITKSFIFFQWTFARTLVPHTPKTLPFEESYLNDIASDTSEHLTIQGQDSRKECHQSHTTNLISKKSLSKSLTFPSPNKISVSKREVDAKEGVNKAVDTNPKLATQPCQRSISMPTPSKLRSALKGGREKEGIQIIDNLTVKWAPDVYDPIPTAVSHVVTPNKNQNRTNSKKNKNKHKRRARGKDKKQQQQPQQTSKYSSVGSTSAKSLDDDVALVKSEGGPQTDLDFNVVGRDPHCGSSFLKESVAENMHFSVAEAT